MMLSSDTIPSCISVEIRFLFSVIHLTALKACRSKAWKPPQVIKWNLARFNSTAIRLKVQSFKKYHRNIYIRKYVIFSSPKVEKQTATILKPLFKYRFGILLFYSTRTIAST